MELYFSRKQFFKATEYPARYKTKGLEKNIGILFNVLFGFLILYKPFGVYEPELKFNYLIICIFHALSPSLIVYAYFSLLNYYRSICRHSKQWTLFKELYQLLIVLFLVGVASFLMRDYIYNNPHNGSLRYFWEEVRNCYLVGGLFYFHMLLTTFYSPSRSLTTPTPSADLALRDHSVHDAYKTELSIQTQVKQEGFSFCPNDLLFVKADGNYVELTLYNNGQLMTELKRISLRQFELQLSNYPFLFRCHRAYLVNLQRIKAVSGNSQGYLLSFELVAVKIPVSRAWVNKFDIIYNEIKGAYSS